MSGTQLPNGRQQFFDANGNPLVSGKVYTYIPSTTTPKSTWQDEALTVLNANPIVLDSLGSAAIWSTGDYRCIVQDVNSVQIWDQVSTCPAGSADITNLQGQITTINGEITTIQADAVTYLLATGGNDTTNLQNALNVGGAIYLQSSTYNYTSLTITKPFRLIGADQSTGSPATVLNCTAANSSDKITIGGSMSSLNGCEFEHIVFESPSATGGAILFFSNTGDCAVRDAQFTNLNSAAIGIKANQVNTLRIEDVRIINPTQAGLYAYGGDATRSDVIDIINFIVSGDSLGAATHLPAGIELDGFVNTVCGHSWKFVTCGRGLWKHNAVGTTLRAEFMMVHDIEIDYPHSECVRIEYGDALYFSNVYFHGSITQHNVYVGTSSPNSVTNLSFIGGNCTGAYKNGMYLDGNYTRVMGLIVTVNSQQGAGTYPGIEIGADSIAVSLQGNQIGSETGVTAVTHSYGVQIDAGAVEYMVIGNDLTGNQTAPLQNLALTSSQNSGSVITNNLGYGAQDLGGAATINSPSTGFSLQVGPGGGNYNVTALELLPSGTLATGTILLPAVPSDGQQLEVFSSQQITALTLTPNTGQTLDVNVTQITANGGFKIQFVQVGSTTGHGRWMRLR